MPIEATIIRWGLLSIPAMALVVAPSFPYPFITPKAFLFRALIEALLIVLLVGALRGRLRIGRELFHAPVLSYVVFVLVLCLAGLAGVNPARSAWGTLERMEGTFQALHYAGFLLLLVVAFRTEVDWLRFFRISLGVSAVVCLYALWQKVHSAISGAPDGLYLPDATIGNSGYLGGYLLLHIFLAAFLSVKARPSGRWLYAGVAFLEMWVLVLSGSRAGLLGLVTGLAVMGLLVTAFSRDRLVRRIGIGAVGVVLIAVVAWGLWGLARPSGSSAPQGLADRLLTLSGQSTQERLRVWKIAVRGIEEQPAWGWGPNNFVTVHDRYYEAPAVPGADWFDSAHNILLDLGVSAGLVGMAVFLAMLGAVIRAYVPRNEDPRGRLASVVLVALVVGCFAHLVFNFPVLVIMIPFLAVVGHANFSEVGSDSIFLERQTYRTGLAAAAVSGKSSLTPFRQVGAVLLIALILMSAYRVTVQPVWAIQAFMAAASPPSADLSYPATLAQIRRTLASSSFAMRELRLFLVERAIGVADSAQVAPEAKRRVLEFAANELREQLEADPEDAHVLWELANLCNMLSPFDPSQLVEAEKRWTQAIAFSPKRPQLYLGLGTTMALVGRLEDTGNLFRKAVALGPTWIEPRIRLLIYYLVMRDDQRAEMEARRLDELISAQRGPRGFTEDEARRLSSVYQQVGKAEKAQEVWNKRQRF